MLQQQQLLQQQLHHYQQRLQLQQQQQQLWSWQQQQLWSWPQTHASAAGALAFPGPPPPPPPEVGGGALLQQLTSLVVSRLADSGALRSFVDQRVEALTSTMPRSTGAALHEPTRPRFLGRARLRFVKELAEYLEEAWVCPVVPQQSLTGVLPVYALPPRRASAAGRRHDGDGDAPPLLAAVAGTPALAAAAEALLARAAQIRRELTPSLSPAQFTDLTQFHAHVDAAQRGQSGRLGGAISGHQGVYCPHLKAWGWSPDS